MKDLIHKKTGLSRIWMQKKYAVFIGVFSKSDIEKRVYLRLANSEEDSEDNKEELLA